MIPYRPPRTVADANGALVQSSTFSSSAFTYRATVYFFAGMNVDSEIENVGSENLTFDLAKADVVGRTGNVAKPCVVWSQPASGEKVRLYPPPQPWYAWSAGCPMPEGRHL